MKKLPTHSAGRNANTTVPSDDSDARLAAYLKKTRPTFAQALAKSRKLGAAANGVLVGPTAGPESVKPLRNKAF